MIEHNLCMNPINLVNSEKVNCIWVKSDQNKTPGLSVLDMRLSGQFVIANT